MVTFNQLWRNHPTTQGEQFPCQTLGVPNFEDQCSIRLGVCLRRSGVTPAEIRGPVLCNHVKLTNHQDDDLHFIRAKELAMGLRRTKIRGIGEAHSLTNPRDFANELNGRTGIIFFNGYWWRREDTSQPTGDNIDLWNGQRTTAKMLIPWLGWLGGYDRSSEIWFWEVK